MNSEEQPYMSEIDKIMNPLMERAVDNFFANRRVDAIIIDTTQTYVRTSDEQSATTEQNQFSQAQNCAQEDSETATEKDVDKLKKSLIRNSDGSDVSVGMIIRSGMVYVGNQRIN